MFSIMQRKKGKKGRGREKKEVELREVIILRISGNCLCGNIPWNKSPVKDLSAAWRPCFFLFFFFLNSAKVPETCPLAEGGLCCM